MFKRFRRWVKADAFYRMFRALADRTDLEYAMLDGSIVKVHRAGQGARASVDLMGSLRGIPIRPLS